MILKAARAAAFAFIGLCLAFVGLLAAWPLIGAPIERFRRSWDARVAIEGHSMEPALEPGDWVLVDPLAYADRAPQPGDLVLAPDPREPARLLIKRVSAVALDGRLELLGDAPDVSTDSRVFGALDPLEVIGRPWFRYWPVGRIGRLD